MAAPVTASEHLAAAEAVAKHFKIDWTMPQPMQLAAGQLHALIAIAQLLEQANRPIRSQQAGGDYPAELSPLAAAALTPHDH